MKTGENPKPRGRPRSFDREAALDAAMGVFWEKGYEGTSISHLTEAMGINPPSLYAAFGDKESLFLAAAERYEATHWDSCPFSEEPTARGSIAKLLTFLASELTGSGHPRGCLLMMAASTSGGASPSLQKAVAKKRTEARNELRARIRKGIADGDVPEGTDADGLADFYATILDGMAQQARDGTSRKSLLATVERAMQLFPEVQRAKKAPPRKTVAA